MDKETLSNYGWIVIAVLVLVVMIALATPFGTFVSEAVQSTTKGLFDVNKSALDSTGLINIDNQEFDVPDMNHGAENGGGNTGETPVEPENSANPEESETLCTATIENAVSGFGEPGPLVITFEEGMTWGEWVNSEYNTFGFVVDRENKIEGGQNSSGAGYDSLWGWEIITKKTDYSSGVTPTDLMIADYVYGIYFD